MFRTRKIRFRAEYGSRRARRAIRPRLHPRFAVEFMAIDKEEPVEQIGSLDQMFANQLAQPRFQTGLMGCFALVALLLAVLGIYGVNAYAVTQRRNELGLRMALGAQRQASVLRQVIGQGMLPTAIGIVLGGILGGGSLFVIKERAGRHRCARPDRISGRRAGAGRRRRARVLFPGATATRIDPAIILRQE